LGIIRRKDGSNRKLKSIVIRPKLPRKELVDAYNAFEEADKVSQLLDKIDNLRKNQLIKNGRIKNFRGTCGETCLIILLSWSALGV